MRRLHGGRWGYPIARPRSSQSAHTDRGSHSRQHRPRQGQPHHPLSPDTVMQRLKLSVATTDYDHFRDFRLGTVTAEAIETTWSMLSHHEIFARFTFNREWDVAELSFAKFMAQVSRPDSDIIGLPVICSRL